MISPFCVYTIAIIVQTDWYQIVSRGTKSFNETSRDQVEKISNRLLQVARIDRFLSYTWLDWKHFSG